MRVVDAFWEQRNLGKKCIEITVEEDDKESELRKLSDIIEADYVVLNVPYSKSEILDEAYRLGYSSIESRLNLTHRLRRIQNRDIAGITRHNATSEDIDEIIHKVSSGKVFTTDRISLDSAFTCKQSGTRYANWIKDLINQEQDVIGLYHNEILVGFSATKKDQNVLNQVLVGIFPEYQGHHLGQEIVLSAVYKAVKMNYASVKTSVSSNNLRSINTHFQAGYELTSMDYVLVKHITENHIKKRI